MSSIRLRPVADADEVFLHRLYATTRSDIDALIDMTEVQKEAILSHQFYAQHKHYREHYSDADFAIVQAGREDIGRLYVHRGEVLEVMDIALLPEFRNRGIGRRLMCDVMDEARDAGKTMLLYVEHYNHSAKRFYERLGFEPVEDIGAHLKMEWCGKI